MEKKALSSKKINKIGLFGGAFNPIHNGHLYIANEAIHNFGLERVVFIPTGNPAFSKEDLLDKTIRLKLCKIAIKNCDKFEVSDFEIKKESTSYYIETLDYFINKFKDRTVKIFSIIGEDAFQQIHRWKDYNLIFKKTEFIIAERYEDRFKSTNAYIENRFKEYKEKIYFLTHPYFRVSSSLIRERVVKGDPIKFLVPESVEKQIFKMGYYLKKR